LIERKMTEEREEVAVEPPAVVAGCGLGNWLVAEKAVDLGVKPPPGVFAEQRPLLFTLGRANESGPFRRLPNTKPHLGQDVAKLSTGSGLIPSAPASTGTARARVQDDALAGAVTAKTQSKRASAIG
jgi:hypothetical protein